MKSSLRHWLYLVLYGCEVSAFCAVGAAYGLRVRLAQWNGSAFHGFPCGRWKQTGIQRIWGLLRFLANPQFAMKHGFFVFKAEGREIILKNI